MLGYLKQGQETAMNQTEFETELGEQGYSEVIDRRMEANSLNPEHAHDFDARLLVLDGAMTIISEGQERMYRAGDTFSMPAGCRHAEQCGPEGVRYLAGRRYPTSR
jgi:quercetin dioxygenase-like cupin family protein